MAATDGIMEEVWGILKERVLGRVVSLVPKENMEGFELDLVTGAVEPESVVGGLVESELRLGDSDWTGVVFVADGVSVVDGRAGNVGFSV